MTECSRTSNGRRRHVWVKEQNEKGEVEGWMCLKCEDRRPGLMPPKPVLV